MLYFGVENNIIPEIGKYYTFLDREDKQFYDTYLHIGKCIEIKSGYGWAMEDLSDGKLYYPYCCEVLDLSKPLMSANFVRSEEKFSF